MDEYDVIFRAINTGGSVAILAFAVYLGLSGRVIPSSMLRTVIAETVRQVLEELREHPPKS